MYVTVKMKLNFSFLENHPHFTLLYAGIPLKRVTSRTRTSKNAVRALGNEMLCHARNPEELLLVLHKCSLKRFLRLNPVSGTNVKNRAGLDTVHGGNSLVYC